MHPAHRDPTPDVSSAQSSFAPRDRSVGRTMQHRPLWHSKLCRSWELLPQSTNIANHLIRNIFLCARQQPLTPAEFLPAYTASIFGRENCLAHHSRKVANPSSTLKCHFLHWLTLPFSSLRDKTTTTFYSLTLKPHNTHFSQKASHAIFYHLLDTALCPR